MSQYAVVRRGDRAGDRPGDLVTMQYYIYDSYDGDLVKAQLAELATMIFGKGCYFANRVDKKYEDGEEKTITSKMTDICKETFGKCDLKNCLWSGQDYSILIKLMHLYYDDNNDSVFHCQVRLKTPLTSAVYQRQKCDAMHCFVASFKFKRIPLTDSETNKRYHEIIVLESHMFYEGLALLDECDKNHIRSVKKQELRA